MSSSNRVHKCSRLSGKSEVFHSACIVFWLKTPIPPNEMDDVIRADLPRARENPVLHDLVKRHTLHGLCGALYPNAPCMNDGVCTETVSTQPSQRDTNRQKWVSIVSKKVKRGWRSQSSLTSKVLIVSKLLQVLMTTLILMCFVIMRKKR